MKSLIITSLSSLILLLPTHGRTIGNGDSIGTWHPTPKIQKIIKDTPLQPAEAAVSVPVAPVVTYSAPAVSLPTGSCGDWLAQAGIPITYGVMELINGESGCRPTAYNPSGACGIGQDINGCEVGYDPVAQLIWMNNYIIGRYQSWANAYSQWLARSPHWY